MAICPLHTDIDMSEVMETIDATVTNSFAATVHAQPFGNCQIYKSKYGKVQIVAIDQTKQHFMDIIDILSQVDHVIFVARAGLNSLHYASAKNAGKTCSQDASNIDTIDQFGEEVLELLIANKLPPHNLVIHSVEENITQKVENTLKELTAKSVDRWLAHDKKSSKKIPILNNPNQLQNTLRGILDSKISGGAKRHALKLSKNTVTHIDRASIFATKVDVVENPENPDVVDAKLYGYVRNCDLDVNGLVHVSNWGTFQVKEVLYRVVLQKFQRNDLV